MFDLLINNYGPDKDVASVHVEVDDTMTASEIDALSRRIQNDVYSEHGVIISTVGIYSVNTGDDEAADMRNNIRRMVCAHDEVLQFHGFYADTENKTISFDVILDFAADDRHKLYEQIKQEVSAAYPDYNLHVALDVDVSE